MKGTQQEPRCAMWTRSGVEKKEEEEEEEEKSGRGGGIYIFPVKANRETAVGDEPKWEGRQMLAPSLFGDTRHQTRDTRRETPDARH